MWCKRGGKRGGKRGAKEGAKEDAKEQWRAPRQEEEEQMRLNALLGCK